MNRFPTFSSLQPSFVEYKFVKAAFDYKRVHDALLRASPDHQSLNFGPGDLEELRVASDDLLASVISAWDGLVEAKLGLENIPTHEKGKRLSVRKRLALLSSVDPAAESALARAWIVLMLHLNDARNEYQHEGYWRNFVGIGQGGGPFALDLIASTKTTERVFVLRDCRRAVHLLVALNASTGLNEPLPPVTNPCPDCFGDDELGRFQRWPADA